MNQLPKEEFLARLFIIDLDKQQNINPLNLDINSIYNSFIFDINDEFTGKYINDYVINKSSLSLAQKRLCLRILLLYSHRFKIMTIKLFKKKIKDLTKEEIETVLKAYYEN